MRAPMRAPKRVPRRAAPRSSQRSVTRAATKVLNPRPGGAAMVKVVVIASNEILNDISKFNNV